MKFDFNFEVTPSKSQLIFDELAEFTDETLVVWWYGYLTSGLHVNWQPKIKVVFRKLVGKRVEDFKSVDINASYLNMFPIGSIWNQQKCIGYADFETLITEIDFYPHNWHETTLEENDDLRLLVGNSFRLKYWKDKNKLLVFKDRESRRIVIHNFELFNKLYGSAEMRRVLLTYPWIENPSGDIDSANRRIFSDTDTKTTDSDWTVHLNRQLPEADAMLAAHIKYDGYTKSIVSKINDFLRQQMMSRGDKIAFSRITPWHNQKVKIKLSGIWLNDDTFLGLIIKGLSEPQGQPIHIVRTRNDKNYDKNRSEESDKSILPIKVNKTTKSLTLTSEASPDNVLSDPVMVNEPTFEILGNQREIQKTVIEDKESNYKTPRYQSNEQADTFSNSDSEGSNKGVGNVSISSPSEQPSFGILQDMWNAAQQLLSNHGTQQKLPGHINSVECYCDKEGFKQTESMVLTTVNIPGLHETNPKTYNWLFINAAENIRRKFLVMRLKISNRLIIICEVQRRTIIKKVDHSSYQESFMGLVFEQLDSTNIHTLIANYLKNIIMSRGVISSAKIPDSCAYKHPPTPDGAIPQMNTLINAINKIFEKELAQSISRKAIVF